MTQFFLKWKSYSLTLGLHTKIMGVLNVTPDSFSDGGKFFDINSALEHGQKLAEDGANIIDIGGESTRPFSEPVSEEEEIRRVIPIIEKLSQIISIPISIDTTKSKVAEKAIEAGASIINDISGLRFDQKLGEIAAHHKIPIILMHIKETPKTMQKSPQYDNLIEEIKAFLSDAVKRAEQSGVSRTNIIIDPGIGFGKTCEHNLAILKNLSQFAEFNLPILIGASRKSFIRKILKTENDKELLPDSSLVETGSQAALAAAALNGAHILRVHDIKAAYNVLKIIDAIKNAE